MSRRFGDWEVMRPLGEGGQSEVFLVRRVGGQISHNRVIHKGTSGALLSALSAMAQEFSPPMVRPDDNEAQRAARFEEAADAFISAMSKAINPAPSDVGALKLMKERDGASSARFAREIEILESQACSNLIRILDKHTSSERQWFVTEFHPLGGIDQAWGVSCPCKGSLAEAWRLLRPIAQVVENLHKSNLIHRDIKAKNVFLANDGRLILADPGIALDADATRLTAPGSDVHSWQWAASWTLGQQEADPTHDVFTLVKLLWAMIAGRLNDSDRKNFMYGHIYDDREHDLSRIFPGRPEFQTLAEDIFSKVLVDRRERCQIETVSHLIQAMDDVVKKVRRRSCPFCEGGVFEELQLDYASKIRLFKDVGLPAGSEPRADVRCGIRRCSNCRGVFLDVQGAAPPS